MARGYTTSVNRTFCSIATHTPGNKLTATRFRLLRSSSLSERNSLGVVHYSNVRTVFTRILERFLQSSNKGLPARLLSSARWLPQAAEAAYRRVISIIGIGGA